MGQDIAAVERARIDIAEGRPWKARERLRAYVKAHPTDTVARELLGDVLYDMRDLPAAGAVWALTTRDDARSREAFAVLRAERPRIRALLAELNVRAPIEAWPPPVQERLRSLQAEGAARGVEWAPWEAHADETREPDGGTVVMIGCALALLVLAACTIVGLAVVVSWALEAL